MANGAYTIVWNWDTLAGGSALKLASTSTAAAGNAQKMLEISLSGSNVTGGQTTYAAYFSNTHTTATPSATNYGLYASVTAAGGPSSTNYGVYGVTSGRHRHLLWRLWHSLRRVGLRRVFRQHRHRLCSRHRLGQGRHRHDDAGTKLQVSGGITAAPTTVSLTADNQTVTVGDNTYIRMSSDNATATNRTFCLTAGTQGQILVLELTSNAAELADNSVGTCGGSPVAANLTGTLPSAPTTRLR